jgi:hypothetical protein
VLTVLQKLKPFVFGFLSMDVKNQWIILGVHGALIEGRLGRPKKAN